MTKKILIVDDHPLMREALQMAFAAEEDLEVIGQASTGEEALNMIRALAPDVILMDLLMPGMEGLEAIEKIFEVEPEAKILVVTSLEEEDKIIAAIQAGALGYFPKSEPRSFLLEAVRKVADGALYLPAGIAEKFLQGIRNMTQDRRATDEPLTSRQVELLGLLSEGLSDAEIAGKLKLSEATVRSHVHNICQRLGLRNRVQAAAYFQRVKDWRK